MLALMLKLKRVYRFLLICAIDGVARVASTAQVFRTLYVRGCLQKRYFSGFARLPNLETGKFVSVGISTTVTRCLRLRPNLISIFAELRRTARTSS